MSPHDFYNAVYSTAIGLGANDTQARLAAAQASEETGFGQHMVGNNLFGIKAGSTYTGPSVSAGTQEEYNGQTVSENANFRSYTGFEDSVRDYLGFIQSNFPDAWSAPTFSDAVKGLNTGVYGKYATRSAYGQHVKAIDGKYGALQYAQDPQNVPIPYSPSAYADLTGLPNDVIPVDDPNFVNADPQFAFAQDPANVPAPEAKPDIPTGGLLTAFQQNPDYSTPFDAILAPQQDQNAWGLNKDVAPAQIPTFNQWDQVASAPPVQSPMGSVQASGLLGANPELAAQATVNPMMNLEASGLLGTTPGLSANATVSGLPEIASVSSRMGVADPGFDQSRFDGSTVSVANDFDQGRFASPATPAFDQSRFAGLLDPATNTQSFMDQPATPANLGSFPDAYASQRGPSTGLLSAEMGQRMADVQRQLLNPSLQAPAVTPSYDVAAAGLLAGNAPLSAQATVPSIMTNETVQDVATPTMTQGLGLLSPESLMASSPALTTTTPTGILGAQPVQQNGFVDSFPDAVTNNTIEPATVNDVVAAPTLDNVQISDQPSVATVDGPATTPALDQQAQQEEAQQQISTPSMTSRVTPKATTQLPGLLSQPAVHAAIPSQQQGLLSQPSQSSGLLAGLLGPSFSQPTTNIGGGMANIAGLYGGAFSPGSFAIANNGAQITQQPGGYVTYENKYGVVEAVGPDGKISSYFGGGYDPTAESSTSGGFFGGLFG